MAANAGQRPAPIKRPTSRPKTPDSPPDEQESRKIRLLPVASQSNNYGLVRPWERGRSFELHHRAPSPRLDHIVERHWIARWDLRGREPFRQETLPHPSINLVIEPDGAWIWGVPTKRDTRMLQAQGWAIGAKFRPGAFTACTGIEASRLTDGRAPVQSVFPGLTKSIAAAVRNAQTATPDSILAALDRSLTNTARHDRRPRAQAHRKDHHKHARPHPGRARRGHRRNPLPRTADASATLPALRRREPEMGACAWS